MQGFLALSRIIDAVNGFIGRYASWLILFMVLISTANALVRKLFSVSSNAFLEVQWYLFAATFMLAGGYVLLHNAHIRIDVISSRFSPKIQAYLDIACTFLFLGPFCFYMFKFGWPMFYSAWVSGETSSNPGGLIRWPVFLLMPVGFGLLAAQGFSEVIKRLAFLTGQAPDPLIQPKQEKNLNQKGDNA